MTPGQLLEKILMLESRKNQARIESTDANEWKKYYDAQLKVIDDYAKERAVEFAKYYGDRIDNNHAGSWIEEFYDTFIKEH